MPTKLLYGRKRGICPVISSSFRIVHHLFPFPHCCSISHFGRAISGTAVYDGCLPYTEVHLAASWHLPMTPSPSHAMCRHPKCSCKGVAGFYPLCGDNLSWLGHPRPPLALPLQKYERLAAALLGRSPSGDPGPGRADHNHVMHPVSARLCFLWFSKA
jgi:hypothetical protein